MKNTCFVSGNCAKDPQYFGEGERRVAKVTLIVDRPKAKDAETSGADMISCSFFGKNADYLEKCEVKKGSNLAVTGRFTTGSYEKEGGEKVYTRDITADAFNGIEVIRDGNFKQNLAVLRGRLTKDPEIRTTASGNKVAQYTLAIDRPIKVKEGESRPTDFPQVVSYGKAAEFAEAYFKKGMYVAIEGHIHSGSYTHKTSGETIYTLDIVADRQSFVQKKSANEKPAGGEAEAAAAEAPAPEVPVEEAPAPEETEFESMPALSELDDDDVLPFN